MTKDEAIAWARERAATGATVMHVPTGTVGIARKVQAEEPYYVSPANGEPVKDPVFVIDVDEVERGLLVAPNAWVELSESAVKFRDSFRDGMRKMLLASAAMAAISGVEKDLAFEIIVSTLKEQSRILEGSR